MSERFEIVMFKKTRNDKTFAVRLGSATKRDDGGFYLNFDALPYGEGSVAVLPPRDKAKPAAAGNSDMEDSIPF